MYQVEWDIVNISDEASTKGLLKYRYQFKDVFDIGIVSIYSDLDLLIKKCDFNDKQSKILKLYQEGFTEEDIGTILNISSVSVYKTIKNCVTKIVNQSKQDWLYEYVYWNKLKTNEDWKLCKRCNTFKQQSQFGMDGRNKDGFKNYCHKCDK